MKTLTNDEIDLILESLQYTKRAFENYGSYPSYEFKQQRIAEVDAIRQKLIQMRRQQNETQIIANPTVT